MLPILSLLLFGGDTLKDFAFAMFIGVATGAYSSIFIAAPVLTMLKKREQALPADRGPSHRAHPDGRHRACRPSTVAAAGTSDCRGAQATTARVGASSKPRPKSKKRPPAKRKRR